jgi:hypothetical protein
MSNSFYKLLDVDGNEINHHNLQDKTKWCKDGERVEQSFVRIHGEQLNIIINPEKTTNKYAPDLLNSKSGCLGDLKTQNTPFFRASSLFGIDPTYAVVFNLKDRNRYRELYPSIDIYYWIDWIAVKFQIGNKVTAVEPLYGVWRVNFKEFDKYLDGAPLHDYMQRRNDTQGNAKSSYVIDIRNEIFEKIC